MYFTIQLTKNQSKSLKNQKIKLDQIIEKINFVKSLKNPFRKSFCAEISGPDRPNHHIHGQHDFGICCLCHRIYRAYQYKREACPCHNTDRTRCPFRQFETKIMNCQLRKRNGLFEASQFHQLFFFVWFTFVSASNKLIPSSLL